MKIGIMSMQRVINYGSFLQAYGLKSVIENLGHHVEFVDYLRMPSVADASHPDTARRKPSILKKIFRMCSPSYRAYRAKQIRMNQSFAEFSSVFEKDFLPHLGISEQPNYCPALDALVIGSDEVFHCTQSGDLVGYSLQLFGKDHRAKKLVSYAASFGSTTLEKMNRYGIAAEVGSHLNSFHALSVRDQNSAQIIETLCGKIPQQHIDPVLLYDFPEVDEIPVSLENYLVVYAYAGRIRPEEGAAIRAFARKQHKKILSLGFYQPFCDEYVLTSPLEVLAYVKHADYVVTDTFHGTVFSIKYQVPFATIIRDSNSQKLSDLLSRFRLDSRKLVNLDSLEQILTAELDQPMLRSLLAEYQGYAMEYLKGTLSE